MNDDLKRMRALSLNLKEEAERMQTRTREAVNADRERMQKVRTRLQSISEYDPAFRRRCTQAMLSKALDCAMQLTGAPMGNIQIFDLGSGGLHIEVHRGFADAFLEFFSVVHEDEAACGTALKTHARTIVEHVKKSVLFQNTAAAEILLDAGVHAVQSTPMIGRSGKVLGIISTHWDNPFPMEHLDFLAMDRLAKDTANWFEEWGVAARCGDQS
jgi:hypothetical protein